MLAHNWQTIPPQKMGIMKKLVVLDNKNKRSLLLFSEYKIKIFQTVIKMNFLFPVLLFLGLFILRTGQKSDAEYSVVLRKIITQHSHLCL